MRRQQKRNEGHIAMLQKAPSWPHSMKNCPVSSSPAYLCARTNISERRQLAAICCNRYGLDIVRSSTALIARIHSRFLFQWVTCVLTLAVAILPVAPPVHAFDIDAGQTVYETHCASCHGADGTPTMPATPDFSSGEGLDATDVDLVRGIKSGRNLMPAYDGLIKNEEILNVITYIRTLRR